MAQTCRQYWWNLQGRCRLSFNWDAIDHDSVVLISASEYAVDPGDPAHSPRFVGAANVGVDNISPHGPPFDHKTGISGEQSSRSLRTRQMTHGIKRAAKGVP